MGQFNLMAKPPMNEAHTLKQLLSRFRSVRDGLPELVKNSKDQYLRLHIDAPEDRQILVISNTASRNLAVIDFAGAPSSQFELWMTWSNPEAGQISENSDIEAGNGNGGKAFMVKGAEKSAYLDSCYKGKRTKMGFLNEREEDLFKPGYGLSSSGEEIRDIDESSPLEIFSEVLSSLSLAFEDIPEECRKVFKKRQSFTVAYLEEVAEWGGRKRKETLGDLAGENLIEILGEHGQANLTISMCQVWVIKDGKILPGGPIKPAEIEPYLGFENLAEIEIPSHLTDPETKEEISVYGEGDSKGYLKLHTSAKPLRMSSIKQGKNVVRIWNKRNNVAVWKLEALHPSASSSFIYGDLRCAALKGVHLEGATRQNLADTPLVQALQEWTAGHVRELSERLAKSMAERTSPKEKILAKNALDEIRKLMRRFLDPDATGTFDDSGPDGSADGFDGAGRRKNSTQVKYGSNVEEILLEENLRDQILIAGTKIPLRYRCIERADDGSAKPVRNIEVVLKSEPDGMFFLNPDGTLTATAPGLGKIRLITADDSVRSNWRGFKVMNANDVEMQIPDKPLKQGQYLRTDIIFQTPDGPTSHCLVQAEVLDATMASITRHGRMKIKYKEGELAVRIWFGDASGQHKDFVLTVGNEQVEVLDGTGGQGSDIPLILLCGESAPGTEHSPESEKTIAGGPNFPTIIEDILFQNIVWINPRSKESMRVRGTYGGSRAVGGIGSKTFINFVALKCFDILKRLMVRQMIGGDKVTENEFMQKSVEAEMECSRFIDDAWKVTENLLGKEKELSDEE